MPNFLNITELKERLHIAPEVPDFDMLLQGYIDGAESYLADPINGVLRRPVLAQEFTETFDSFCDVILSFPDDARNVTVTYADADGVLRAVGDVFTVKDGRLRLKPFHSWPTARSVTATYTAGWDESEVPDGIKEAGYFIARSMFEQGDKIDPDRFRSVVAFQIAGFRRATL